MIFYVYGKKLMQKGKNMKSKNLNKTKILVIGITMGALLTSLISCSPLGINSKTADKEENIVKVEGTGYASPEKAVEAYLNYLKEENLEGAMSTFAVESYADNFDMKAYYEYMQSYTAFITNGGQMTSGFYFDSDMSRDINIESRRAYICSGINKQLMQIVKTNSPDTRIAENLNQQIRFEDDNISAGDVMTFLSTDPMLDSIAIGEYLTIEDFDFPNTQTRDKAMEDKEKYWGADLEEVIVELNIAHEDYTLFMLCVCYDNKWYVADFGNPTGLNCGITYVSMGMVPEEEFSRK